MSIWNSVISVLGTLGGLLGGYWISSQMESRKRKHESAMEYRNEIRRHMDDIIKPLFIHLQNLWGSLAILQVSIDHKSSVARGKTLKDLLLETRTANQTLREFVHSKYDEMNLLLPSPFPWVFAPLDELVEWRIIEPILQGKEPTNDITLAVNTAMKIQKNLRRLIGFETDVEMEKIYPFSSSKDNKEDTVEEKLRFTVRALELFLASIMGAFAAKLLEPYWSMPDLSSKLVAGSIVVVVLLAYAALFYLVLYEALKFAKRWRRKK